MNQATYIKILEEIVIANHRGNPQVILKEDGDSVHRGQKLTKFKEEHGIKYNINRRESSDLASIENAWKPLKGVIRRSRIRMIMFAFKGFMMRGISCFLPLP